MKTNPKMSLSDSPESKSLLARYHELADALGEKVGDPVFEVPTGPGSRTWSKGKVAAYIPRLDSVGVPRRTVTRDTADAALEAFVDMLTKRLRARVDELRALAAARRGEAVRFDLLADDAAKVLHGES